MTMTDAHMNDQNNDSDTNNNNNNNTDKSNHADNDARENKFICGVVEGFYGRPWSYDQRLDLFKKLKDLELNTYMYAPKVDQKHRSDWRQMYNDDELEELKSLIDEARARGIDFYYSLAPGLDMTYSDPQEVKLLLNKYEQVLALGCDCFAILFDDIDTKLNELDRKVFDNYALAQCSVSNLVYEHLKRPNFLFCPTEYCETRAVPTLEQSEYLNTVGSKLASGIGFMWSGQHVVPRYITPEDIDRLTAVIKRRPVIWENLHANDYDKKRLYLGPFSGRSTKLIPKINGIITNPNCEYEANHIAIHTLAQWSRCTQDLVVSSTIADDTTRMRSVDCEEGQRELKECLVYDPKKALSLAIQDWLPRLLEHRPLPTGTNIRNLVKEFNDGPPLSANVEPAVGSKTDRQEPNNHEVRDEDKSEVEFLNVDMIAEDIQTLECVVTKCLKVDEGEDSPNDMTRETPMQQEECALEQEQAGKSSDAKKNNNADSYDCAPDTENNDCACSQLAKDLSNDFPLSLDNLSLLVDLYYLPFQHGSSGDSLLSDLKWLKANSDSILSEQHNQDREDVKMADSEQSSESSNLDKPEGDWLKRADRLDCLCQSISNLISSIIHCPNKSLVVELYPYLSDMLNLSAVIKEYIKFLRYRTSSLKFIHRTSEELAKQSAMNGEYQLLNGEPWQLQGGLIGDVHRLLIDLIDQSGDHA